MSTKGKNKTDYSQFKIVGERLSILRREQGYSQQTLANKTGLALSALWLYERSESLPAVPTLLTLAKFYRVSIDYILGRTNFRALEDTNDPVIRMLTALNDRDYFCVEALLKEMTRTKKSKNKKESTPTDINETQK